MKKLILKHALLNAVEYGGKANVQAVLGKVIAEDPELRKDIKAVAKEIGKIVKEVNSWNLEKQKKKLKTFKIRVKKKAVKEKFELPELPDAEMEKVVTAFPPEPSKYPHLGHAKAALINFMYAKKYNGKFILRFEDTNPELSKQEYYQAIIDGLKWLGISWDAIDYLSDHIENYYKITERLINENQAYVCTCQQEKVKENRKLMTACEHRSHDASNNLELWNKMLTELKEGDASVRLKISMEHQNAAMRDPVIMRIAEGEHPRTKNKYRVWPLYDFGTALMDAWGGITHRIRSKEFEMRTELQQHIQKLLGLPSPYITEIARFNLQGVPSSGRIIREMIKNKQLMGWDDPRLSTLMALKRRGFHPDGIKEFLISTGVSKAEATLTWDILESFNRSVVDSLANRYFAVINPVQIKIVKAPKIKEAEEILHPDFPRRGKRKILVNANKIFIAKEDLEKHKGQKVRLIGLFNVVLNKKAKFDSEEVVIEMPKIQWVSEKTVAVKIIMPDGSKVKGIAEPEVANLKVDDLIQFMRLGFCRLDQIEPEVVFYFTHR